MYKITLKEVETISKELNDFRDIGEDSFCVEARHNIPKYFKDQSNSFCTPDYRFPGMLEKSICVFDLNKKTIKYFSIGEEDLIRKEYSDIQKLYNNYFPRDSRCSFTVLNLGFDDAIICKFYNKKFPYEIKRETEKEGKVQTNSLYDYFYENWFLFLRNGQIFTNFPERDLQDLSTRKIREVENIKNDYYYNHFFNLFDGINTEIHGYDWQEIFDEYISKIFPNICYYKGRFLNIREDEDRFFFQIANYKEPSLKNSRNQKIISELSKCKLIENSIANSVLEDIANKKIHIQEENGVINKVDAKENVSVIRRICNKQTSDHARLYFFQDKILAAFKNRFGEYVLYQMQNKDTDKFKFNLDKIEEYPEFVFEGTKLQYIKSLVLKHLKDIKSYTNISEAIYAISKNDICEEFLRTKYAKDLSPREIKPDMVEELFGKTNNKAKGFYKKVGLNHEQVDLIYKAVLDIGIAYEKRQIEQYKKVRDYPEHELKRRIEDIKAEKRCCYAIHFRQIVSCVKSIFNPDPILRNEIYYPLQNFVDISYIDPTTFKKVLDVIRKAYCTNDIYNFNLYWPTETMILFKKIYPDNSFKDFLDYFYKIVTEHKNPVSENGVHEGYILPIYKDYLLMISEADQSKRYPWKFESIYQIIKAHDDLILEYNKYIELLESEDYLDKIYKDLEKNWKNYEFKSDDFLLTYPRKSKDLKDEGQKLHHCVASFTKQVAQGYTNIFFIRKIAEPDKPFFTLELKDNEVRQVHGFANRNANTEEGLQDFIKSWANKNNVIYKVSDANKALA